jgi:heme A synthase
MAFLGVTFFAFKTERRSGVVFWTAFVAGLLLVAQIILGGITVKKELPPEIVAAHLGTAMLFMGALIITICLSLARTRESRLLPRALDSTYTRLALLSAVAALATLVLGSYISGTAASLACDGWPLCNGSIAPRGDAHLGLHYMHRVLAGVLGLFVAGTIWAAFDERRGRATIAASLAAEALYITQALIGAANIWTELADEVVITHLSLAALLWCLLLTASVMSFYVPGRARQPVATSTAREDGNVTEWAR